MSLSLKKDEVYMDKIVRQRSGCLSCGNVNKERFYWLTNNKLTVVMEKMLLANLKMEGADTVLEIGCGEGADIYNLNSNVRIFVGIDLYYEKLNFAKSLIKNVNFICADVLNLPFCDNYFDLVFCKDVLHHIVDKDKMIKEMIRVCKPKKRIVIIEANGRNFFWIFFGTVIRQELGVKENTIQVFKQLFKNNINNFSKVTIDFLYIPMFFKLLIHYKFGIENLGNNNQFLIFSNLFAKFLKKIGFKKFWPYIIIVGIKK